jgi:YfiH family protein
MADWLESAEAIGAVDAIFAGGGLTHGRRASQVVAPVGAKIKLAGGSGNKGLKRVPAGKRSLPEPAWVRVAAWDKLGWLKAGFSARQGGVSTAYAEGNAGDLGELNLGWTREDTAKAVAANRRRFLEAVAPTSQSGDVGHPGMELVTLRQFHSGMVRVLGGPPTSPEWSTADGKAVLRGDGMMTDQAGLLLGIQTADCVPVLLADTRTRAVAAFHAGWRGTLARIVERGVGQMRLEFGSKPEDLVAAIGPAIGRCCFAVGEEVRFEFESQFAYAPELFSEVYDSDPVREKYPMLFLTARAPGHSNLGPQIHLDLHEANRRQLLDAGLRAAAISMVGECSGCTRLPDGRRKYFSHRMERGYTGRMLSVIGVTG